MKTMHMVPDAAASVFGLRRCRPPPDRRKADGANLKKAKDAFYSDFARCIIIFGLKVLAKTFNNGHSTFAAAAEAVANGALAVSLADFAGSLIDYYRTSEYVSE